MNPYEDFYFISLWIVLLILSFPFGWFLSQTNKLWVKLLGTSVFLAFFLVGVLLYLASHG